MLWCQRSEFKFWDLSWIIFHLGASVLSSVRQGSVYTYVVRFCEHSASA